MLDLLVQHRRAAWILLGFAVAAAAAGHALLAKRDVRAAVGWVALILAFRPWGALAYLLLGVNRIQRRASALRAGHKTYSAGDRRFVVGSEELRARAGDDDHLAELDRQVRSIVPDPLLRGNRVEPLASGGAAFDRMLEAIAGARRSVALATYIFDRDEAGREFVAALAAAVARGVQVRVLVDSAGERYSFPSIRHLLRRRGVRSASFNRSRWPWRMPYANLRNHRKLLLVDGTLAFTGGMNIRQGHRVEAGPRHPVRDLHFEIHGPVVATLRKVFAEDWTFTTRESLAGEAWFPPLEAAGEVLARGIVDGPDESFEALLWTLLSALSVARRSVRVLTPYFLPDRLLTTSLVLAARRGVEVEIVLPERGNLRLVQWASDAGLGELLAGGCRIYRSPPPFDHTKLMVVDGVWSLIGSANWDPRSLQLNFELDVECTSRDLAGRLGRLIDAKCAGARPMDLEDVRAQSLPRRLRDNAARLLTPYL